MILESHTWSIMIKLAYSTPVISQEFLWVIKILLYELINTHFYFIVNMNSICCGNENSASKFSLKRQNSDFWLLNTSIPFSFSSKLLSQPLWCFFTKSLLFFRYTMLFQPFKLFYIWDFLFPGIPFNLLTAWQNVGNPSTRCYSLAWEHHQQP